MPLMKSHFVSPPPPLLAHGVVLAVLLSLGAAVSLGITRFAYGLLLPPMRDDLGWTYALAGSMNTFNAVGYLVGALTAAGLMRRWGAGSLLWVAALMASVFMASSGFFVQPLPLQGQRLLAGVASAWVFVAGGLLAARLGALWPHRMGLILGVYYGGTGWGVVVSALVVPVVMNWAHAQRHAWVWAWWTLALVCVGMTLVLAILVRRLRHMGLEVDAPAASTIVDTQVVGHTPWTRYWQALVGYTLFGVGYIGYMTFVVALLHDRGTSSANITLFYALLGLALVAASRLWAPWFDRFKGGQTIARLNALLGVATIIPVVATAWWALLLSGMLFGAVFLSVVASTTAFVRHNLPAAQWAAGISAFTIVFAVGQIVGPAVVGWIGDGPGGLERGLLFSTVALWLGSAVAWLQKPISSVHLARQ
jgi:predicted MFS family arabinose efflux permease